MNRLVNLAARARRLYWRVFKPRTRGVKVMVFNGRGELLLVRHSYGRTAQFLIPGGGIRPFETPEKAAHREIREEVGCGLTGVALRSRHFSGGEGKRDTVYLFTARTVDEPVADNIEVEEARFFKLDRLPANLSPATRRRIEEHLGNRTADGSW